MNINELKDFNSWSDDKKKEYKRLLHINEELVDIKQSIQQISSNPGFSEHIEKYYFIKSQGKI